MRALVMLVALWPALAVASPRRWAIGEIRVEGEVADGERPAIEERAWRALTLALPTDALVAPHAAVAEALAEAPALRGCTDDRCSLALGDRLRVERLVTARVERRGRDWTARLLAYAVDAAEVAGTLELPCAGCDVDGLLAAFARAAAPLLRDGKMRPLCLLTVQAPPGTTVRVDTVALGTAPFAHTVAAGRHTVAADLPSAPAEPARSAAPAKPAEPAEIDCPDGGARTVRLSGPGPAPRSRARAWKLGLGGAAAALALGSLAGLATAAAGHDRGEACDAGRCAYRDDATAGIALGAVGVAAFGAAAAVLFATARRDRALAIGATPGGVAVTGSF
jgi:hypothetical protein